MRIRTILTTAAAVTAGFLAIGCGNTSNTGGGASKNTGGGGTSTPAGDPNKKMDDTFTIKGPLMAPTIKQGETQKIELSLGRGKDFKEPVKLAADAPKGLTAKFDKDSIAAGDPEKTNLSVEVAKDAPVGDHVIKVTGTPGAGSATSLDVKVKVDAAK